MNEAYFITNHYEYGPVMNSRSGGASSISWHHHQARFTVEATGELPRPPLHKWAYRLIKTILGNIGLIDRVKPPATAKELAEILGWALNYQHSRRIREMAGEIRDRILRPDHPMGEIIGISEFGVEYVAGADVKQPPLTPTGDRHV